MSMFLTDASFGYGFSSEQPASASSTMSADRSATRARSLADLRQVGAAEVVAGGPAADRAVHGVVADRRPVGLHTRAVAGHRVGIGNDDVRAAFRRLARV